MLGKSGDFERTGAVLLANPGAWDSNGRDSRILYRELKQKSAAEIFFASFDADSNGFCNNDAILEIMYRDNIGKAANVKDQSQGDVIIQSRLDFSGHKQFFEIGNLSSTGDGRWKVISVFLEKTPRQMIRAIDGSFQFKLIMPPSGTVDLQVSYIKLRMVTHKELTQLREKDRAKRGLVRNEFEPNPSDNKQPDPIPKSGFDTYPVNYLELVFPTSPVKYEHINEGLKCFEVAGEAEPVTFVIHSYDDLEKVHVTASNLRNDKGIILNKNIDIRRVVYNDQRWGWNAERYYGTSPDYLSFSNPTVDLDSNSNCQFWLTINIPEDTPAGIYRGNVTVQAKNKEPYVMPFEVNVLPVKFLSNKPKHMLWHSPYGRNFSNDPVAVFKDMKKHGLVPIFDLTSLESFEKQLKKFRQVYPEPNEVFVNSSSYYYLWRTLKGPKPDFQRPFPQFNAAYTKLLKEYDALAKRYGLEFYFTFFDEPFKYADKRRISYLCSQIAHQAGLKTWSTQNLADDVQLPLTEEEKMLNVNYLKPLREVLDVFADNVILINEKTLKTFQDDKPNLSYYTTYPATSIRPAYNRVLHGVYPFVTKSNYVLSYAYHDASADPYDDMDRRVNYPYEVGMNDYLLVYPTWQGELLPTMSYEALREGIEDSRLIGTLQMLAQYASQSNDAQARKLAEQADTYLNGLFKKLSRDFENSYFRKHKALPLDPMEEAILKDLGDGRADYSIFNNIRRQVCEQILAFQNFDEVKKTRLSN